MVETRILIVEDTDAARDLAVRMLGSLGYTVMAVPDANVAINLLRIDRFDVLFTDVIMPGEMDGIALAQYVRREYPYMKILFTSGFSLMNPDDITKLEAIYVAKPYRKKDIAVLLQRLLDTPVTTQAT